MAPYAQADRLGFATKTLHADHHLLIRPEVAPSISVATTFRHPSPAEVAAAPPGHYDAKCDPFEPSRDIYLRYTQPTLTQAEAVLSSVIGQPTIVFPNGLAATCAILLHVIPDVIAITGEDRVQVIGVDDEYPTDKKLLLFHNRTYTVSTEGSLESWLLLRSLRTLSVRITRQVQTATKLAHWLNILTSDPKDGNQADGPIWVIQKVWHVSLQDNVDELIGAGKQMSMGTATFAFLTTKEIYALHLGNELDLFQNATSLGGVESLVKQRLLADENEDPHLVRFSIGLEDFEDLKADVIRGLNKVLEIEKAERASNLTADLA
ncbi:BQ2448_5562 [Microbotryum intermedium]|uniref:BQ2448_5562 protein n=1 Tax=Microbotryum intermedium TaxID=269621 RepID=A0A238F740_9BASI|nr:BQ2448_5562 [Microbotryum intermedium]